MTMPSPRYFLCQFLLYDFFFYYCDVLHVYYCTDAADSDVINMLYICKFERKKIC